MRKLFVLSLGIAISALLAADARAQSSSRGDQSDPAGVQQQDRDRDCWVDGVPPQKGRLTPQGSAPMTRAQKRQMYLAAKQAAIAAYEAKKAAAREQLRQQQQAQLQQKLQTQLQTQVQQNLQTQTQLRTQAGK